jgi:hypothetical protein
MAMCDSRACDDAPEDLPDVVTALQAGRIAERERAARIEAALAIAKLTRQLYGSRSALGT